MNRLIPPSRGPLWLVALVLGLFPAGDRPVFALDPARAVTQYGVQSWTSRTGLPGEAVYNITQTPDGYLWLRTNGGVSRFDGVRFTPLELRVGEEQIREVANSSCRGADGSLLVRTVTRTLRYKAGTLTDDLEPGPLLNGVAKSLFETSAGRVWVGGDCSSNVVKDGRVVEVKLGIGQVYAFLEDRRGDVWVGTTNGLFQYRGDRLMNPPSSFPKVVDVRSLAEDREGNLWVGTSWGLFRLAEGRVPEYMDVPGIAGRAVSAILQDRDGVLWVGTNSTGLFRLSGSGWQSLAAIDGLTSNAIVSLYEDREGSLWVGTVSGLNQLRDTNVLTFSTREGLPHHDIYAVMEARDGSVYVTCARGLVRFRDGAMTVYTSKDGLANDYCSALCEGADGSIWIGTALGLSQLKDGLIRSYRGIGAMGTSCVTGVCEDQEGILIMTTDKPPLRLRGRVGSEGPPAAITLADGPGVANYYFFTICPGQDGTIWYGTTDGLYRAPGGDFHALVKEPKVSFPVTSIWDDGRGFLWLAGREPGVIRYRIADGNMVRYTTASGLFEDALTRAVCDRDGNLWASTPRGIFRVARKDLDDFAEGRRPAIRSVAFGTVDGMKTTESTIPEHQTAGWAGRDGRLWFATRDGVVVIDPSRIRKNEYKTPVVLEQVVVDQKPLPPGRELRLAPGSSRIEFHYTGLSLRVPERVQFRYRLDGFDSDWIDAGNQRTAYYTNLPPGRYRFRVRACNDDGLWVEGGASADLELPPRFHQTAQFKAACLAGGLLLLGGAYRARMTAFRRRERELTRLVRERTVELEEAKVELEVRNERLSELAATDGLTGLWNRRHFLEALGSALPLAAIRGRPTSVLMIDVDHFKSFNDTLGHLAGDDALRVVASVLRARQRSYDIAARYGGEEFIILLPETDREDAACVAERLRHEIESVAWPKRQITASIGVATARGGVPVVPESLVDSADRALYLAKRLGRNRVEQVESGEVDDPVLVAPGYPDRTVVLADHASATG